MGSFSAAPAPYLLAVSLIASGCQRDTWSASLVLVDEAGDAVGEGWVDLDGERIEANGKGRVRLRGLERPVLVLAGGPGLLTEPVPVGFEDQDAEVELTLLASQGRRVLHFGGDVMMGRRYLEPKEGEPLLGADSIAADAREVVADLGPAFSAADFSVVNLETVLGEGDVAAAYPGKRWLLSTPPEALSALDELGVDLVTLGNNHLFDWMDAGVAETQAALDAAGVPAVGAGLSRDLAEEPVVIDVGGLRVGVLSATTVDGTWVNDQYPDDATAEPAELEDEDAWQWEARSWGWSSADGSAEIPVAERRLGGAWAEVALLEEALSEADQGLLWASVRGVYPELQDWVARRGHGGAAFWDADRAAPVIAELGEQADLVVVQLHMGFQFSEAPASGAREAAQDAVDAGADLVIMHHPHVLQGVEWLGDGLVVYSLGNMVFDQDFLSTFPSGFLRVVVDDAGGVVQVRFVPAWLDAYRPAPVTGGLARRVQHQVWERSVQGWTARRGSDGLVRAVADGGAPSPDARAPRVILEHHTLRFTDEPASPERIVVELEGRESVEVPPGVLLEVPVSGVQGLELGRGLLALGGFEDEDTDLDPDELIGWLGLDEDAHRTGQDASSGARALELVARPSRGRTTARAVARAALPEHRVYSDADGSTPLDGPASYTVRLQAWATGETDLGLVRLALYHFDDLDPTRAPDSVFIEEVELPFVLPSEYWTPVEVDLPLETLTNDDGLRANMALVYISASEPRNRTSVMRVDELELVEWRSASRQAEGYARVDFLRGASGEVELVGLTSGAAP